MHCLEAPSDAEEDGAVQKQRAEPERHHRERQGNPDDKRPDDPVGNADGDRQAQGRQGAVEPEAREQLAEEKQGERVDHDDDNETSQPANAHLRRSLRPAVYERIARVRLPPLLEERPQGVQVLLAIVVPVVYGAVTGYFLGKSEGVWVVLNLLAAIGGVGAGFDHLGARAGARRGALGGALFGAALLIGHEIQGGDPKASIPHPGILLIVVTVVLGVALGALGGYMRGRAAVPGAA